MCDGGACVCRGGGGGGGGGAEILVCVVGLPLKIVCGRQAFGVKREAGGGGEMGGGLLMCVCVGGGGIAV